MIKEFLSLHGDYSDKKYFRELTTIKMGGKIAHYVEPYNQEDLSQIVQFLRNSHYDYKILGNGSNLIAGSSDYDGVIISLNHFDDFKIEGTKVYAEAGVLAPYLAGRLAKEGLSGFEFASGIPGSIGGLLYMNAGAYKSDISSIVEKVLVFRKGHFDWLSKEEMEFSYRHSILQDHPHWMAIACVLKLEEKNSEEICAMMNERLKRRKNSQPLERLSAGSVFRNPEGSFAWKYIDELGYRGYRQGDIEVSDKHPNFIVNCGEGKAEDFLDIVYKIQEEVLSSYGVKLVMEVEKFNC